MDVIKGFYDFLRLLIVFLEPLFSILAWLIGQGYRLVVALVEWCIVHITKQVPPCLYGRVKSSDLTPGRFLGQGCSGIIYETTWSRERHGMPLLARKAFPAVPAVVFEKEAARLVDLDHPNIVKTLGWTVDRRSCSLITEHMKYNLFSVVEKRKEAVEKRKEAMETAAEVAVDPMRFYGRSSLPFPLRDAVNIMLQIALGMEYVHDRNLAHGGLKPNNVLVDSETDSMSVKVADFGMTETKKMSTALVSHRALCLQILKWKAPELFEDLLGSSTDDPGNMWTETFPHSAVLESAGSKMQRADIYSFALTCSYILGALPCSSNLGLFELREVIASGVRPHLPDECPKMLESVILACWNKDPSRRPIFEDICKDLRAVEWDLQQREDNSSFKAMESTEAMEPISQVSEALRVIEDVKEMSTKSLVNKRQCRRLADRVNAIGEALPKMEFTGDNTSAAGKVDRPAFDMLLSVLQKAEALVSKYITAAASIPNVLTRTENRKAFKEVHTDLDAMHAQFPFENFESSTSESERDAMLTEDAAQDLKELSESLDVLAKDRQAAPTDLEQVKLVVSEKSKGTSDVALPSYLNIDPSLVEVLEPVRLPERLSIHDPVETDGRTLVCFGTWLGCRCAVKVFQSGNKTWNRSEFLKEAQALTKLHHPHIVQLMGFAQDEEKCLILMELMDDDLRHFMKSRRGTKRPFSRTQELEIITQIASGMYYLHEQQYVHGELKCSNILIKQFSGDYVDVKVSDLRSCQKLGVWDPALFKERSVRCRPRWAAPEVTEYTEVESAPSDALIKKIDIYSFGMVCYEILTGNLPFQGIQGDALTTRIARGDLRQNLPSELDENLRGLIEACWERDPEKRPTFELISHTLDFIRSSQPLAQPDVTSISSGKTTVLNLFKRIPVLCRLFGGLTAKTDPPITSWGFNDAKGTDTESHEEAEDADTTLPGFVSIDRTDLKQGVVLGKSASATVYEATWIGCKVAVKAFTSRSMMQTLKDELKFPIELRHPAVVRLLGLSVSANGQFLIVMEIMGGDLRQEIEKRMQQRGPGSLPFEIQDAVYIINRIALGMAYLHSKGVVHRDLKASNVFMPWHPGSIDVKISDFGVSELIDSGEKGPLRMAGTGFWRAPELWSTSQHIDLKAADVYSFAMTCFEVLTGKVPGAGSTGITAMKAGAKLELPEELLPELKQLIAACRDEEPKKRPTFASICTELEKIQQGLRTLA